MIKKCLRTNKILNTASLIKFTKIICTHFHKNCLINLYRHVNVLNVKYVNNLNVKCYLKILFSSPTFSFPTV